MYQTTSIPLFFHLPLPKLQHGPSKNSFRRNLVAFPLFPQLSNTQKPDKQFCQYQPSGSILKTSLIILSHTDKLHALVVEKTKFDLVKARLEKEARLAMIKSRRSLTAPTSNGRNNKEIDETSRENFALAPQFTGPPQREISKIFQN